MREFQMKTVHSLLVIVLLFAGLSSALAQDTGTGQFCIQAFEDRNQNGRQDTGEPALVQGVTANLKDSTGIIIDSATMDESPTAANGIICFQYLTAGQYSVSVSSAEFSATTPNEFVTSVNETGVPSIFYFGGERIIAETSPVTATSSAKTENTLGLTRTQLEGLLFGVIGAAIAMGAMAVIGALIYASVFGKRLRQMKAAQTGYYVPSTTGSMPPVTGQYPPYTPPPGTGSMPPVQPDDTGQYKQS